jgi:hypothetical protein
MKNIGFFDPHTGDYLLDKKGAAVSESMKHTALEYLFPNSQFSVAVLDERTTAKELQENHPDNDRMLLASGSRFVFTDPETIKGLEGILPGKINPIAYGSLLLKETNAKHEQLRVVMVPEDGNEYELNLANKTFAAFKETGILLVDLDPAPYLKLGTDPASIPQLLLPQSAIPDLQPNSLKTLRTSELAERLTMDVRKIELAPQNFVRQMKILVVDSKTGASSSSLNSETGKLELGFDNIDPDFAKSITGDGHGCISNELAASKFDTDSRTLVQMRLIAKNQDPDEVSPFSDHRVGKGVVVARNLAAIGVDAVFDESIHKGGDKIPPGIYEVNVWMGEIDRSKENGKQSIAALLPLYPELLEDIIPVIEPEIANLSAIQNDPIAVAKSFCDNFERLRDRLTQDPNTPGDLILPSEKYDVIKQSLVTGNTALLQSPLCAPTLIDHIRTSYLNLALASHEDLKFNRSMIAPSNELKDDEICIYGVPEGTKVIVGRAPVIGKNGIHELTVKHIGDFDYADPDACPNYIYTNNSVMSEIVGQQSAVVDMGADWDGDHLFWEESSKYPNLAIGVRNHQADRDVDIIKLSKSEFPIDMSIEEAALQAETAPIGVIANMLIKTHSQISAIDMVRDLNGVATDDDRSQLAGKIRDQLYNFKKWTTKKEEPLMLPSENLMGAEKELYERFELCNNARVAAILQAPRFDLLPNIPDTEEDRFLAAKDIKRSLFGFSKNNEKVWFTPPNEEGLEPKEQESFKALIKRSEEISDQISAINSVFAINRDGTINTDGVEKVLESYQELKKSGVDLILGTEKELLRDVVGFASFQNQVAVSMKKSATIAEAPLVQRLNHLLPSKTPMISEKKNGVAYAKANLTIDGTTPAEVVAARVNSYFSKTEIIVSSAIRFKSLFDNTASVVVSGRVHEQKLAFDADWNHAVRLASKAKNEEGCVLKVFDSLDRELEITNLSKFPHDLAYDPEKLKGLKFKIDFNHEETEHGLKSYLKTDHKHVLLAQTGIVAEPKGLWEGDEIHESYNSSPPQFNEVLGTVCDFSTRKYDITDEEIGVIGSLSDVRLLAPQPDLSDQYFRKARDTALKFRAELTDEGADLNEYASALWHESTNRAGGVLVDDYRYKTGSNSMSPSICYFFPEQLKAQIAEQPLNLHRISLSENIDNLVVGEDVLFRGSRDRVMKENGFRTYQRTINLSTDGGENFEPIGALWQDAIPMDMSGRSLSGKIVAAGNSQMLLQVPGIDDPIVFGAVDKNFLKDKPWIDGAVNITFEPIVKSELSLHFDGKSIGKVDSEGVDLLRHYKLDSGILSVVITQKAEGKLSALSISIPKTDDRSAFSFDLQGKGLVNLAGKGHEVELDVKVVPKNTHSLGVFMTGEDGVKRQIGEFTTHNTASPAMASRTPHATSAKSIKALVKAGYVEWEDLKVVQHDGADFLQGEKPNRSFAPVILKNPGEVQLMNSNQNFAIELDRDILPERLPVVQREFKDNFIGRVYANFAPKLDFETTTGLTPKIQAVDSGVLGVDESAGSVVIPLKSATLDSAKILMKDIPPSTMKVLISGSISVLPVDAKERIDKMVGLGAEILVGDKGVGVEVQNYLKALGYDRLTVYDTTDPASHNAMCIEAKYGLAILEGDSPVKNEVIDGIPTVVVHVALVKEAPEIEIPDPVKPQIVDLPVASVELALEKPNSKPKLLVRGGK